MYACLVTALGFKCRVSPVFRHFVDRLDEEGVRYALLRNISADDTNGGAGGSDRGHFRVVRRSRQSDRRHRTGMLYRRRWGRRCLLLLL